LQRTAILLFIPPIKLVILKTGIGGKIWTTLSREMIELRLRACDNIILLLQRRDS